MSQESSKKYAVAGINEVVRALFKVDMKADLWLSEGRIRRIYTSLNATICSAQNI